MIFSSMPTRTDFLPISTEDKNDTDKPNLSTIFERRSE